MGLLPGRFQPVSRMEPGWGIVPILPKLCVRFRHRSLFLGLFPDVAPLWDIYVRLLNEDALTRF